MMSSLIEEEADLVEVVSRYSKVKRIGSTYFALCPFHYETFPSFHIDPVKQLYYCHGCGKGGNLKTFLREFGLLETKEDSLPDVVTKYWNWILMNSEPLLKKIKSLVLSEIEINRFRIGYSFGKTYEYLQKKGFSENELEKSGIFIQTENGLNEIFERRFIFPITEKRSIVSWVGWNANGSPKYIYPKNSRIKEILFGFDLNQEHIRRANKAIVVEGIKDFVGMSKKYSNVVCSFGCNLSYVQQVKISRIADEIIFAFDGDDAGIWGVRKSLEAWSGYASQIKVAVLPDGKDPYDLYELNLLDKIEIVSLPQFYLKQGWRLEDLAKIIAKAERDAVLELEIKEAATIFNVSEKAVISEVNRFRPKQKRLITQRSPEQIFASFCLKKEIPIEPTLFLDSEIVNALNNLDLISKAKLTCLEISADEIEMAIDKVLDMYLLRWASGIRNENVAREVLLLRQVLKEYFSLFLEQ